MKMKRFFVIALLFLLTACGFSPLYAQKDVSGSYGSAGVDIVSEMRQIKVEPISDRFGQLVRNNLLDSLTPTGVPSKPKYRLFVRLKRKSINLQALREDISATREMAIYQVEYSMKEGDKVLFRNESVAYASYDVLNNPYSTTVAQKKAEKEAAQIIADDISLRVGAYFHLRNANLEQKSDL